VIDPEQVAPAQRFGAPRERVRRHATDPCRRQHGADARAGIQRRHDTALLERFHHADVREAFHAAPAKDEGNAT
jgi:hypothetical protein